MAKVHITSCGVMRKVIQSALSTGDWKLLQGGKHLQIIHTSGRCVPFTQHPTCQRAAKNVARDIRHVEAGIPGPTMSKVITRDISLGKRK